MRVTGQYYRALSGHRDELASTSYELYTEISVRPTCAVNHLFIGAVPVCRAKGYSGVICLRVHDNARIHVARQCYWHCHSCQYVS